MSLTWLNHFLNLEDFSPYTYRSDSPENSQCPSEFEFQERRETDRGVDKSQLSYAAKKRKSKPLADKSSLKDNCSLPKSVRFQNCVVSGAPTDVDNGKKQWVHKPRPRITPCLNRNAKIVIGENLVQETNRELVEYSTSSSFDSDRSWGAFSNFSLLKGDCSNNNKSNGFWRDGPPLFEPSKETASIPSGHKERELLSYRNKIVGQGCITHKDITEITIDLIGECEAEDHLGQPILKQADQGGGSLANFSDSKNNEDSGAFGNQKPYTSGKSSSASNFQEDAQTVSLPKTPNRRKGGKRCMPTKSHAMKTMNSKANPGRSEDALDKDSSDNRWTLAI
ncbi:hypothetical protein QYF36_021676 [Acer negundo]|nr:hypothetical protein QYF36_021676 [Acer negundo]